MVKVDNDKYEYILNVKTYCLSYENLKNDVIDDIIKNKKSFIAAINPEKIIATRKDTQLLKDLNKVSYPIPDGIGIVLASKIKKGKIKNRITGIDTMEMLCEIASEEKYKIFLYGSKEESVKKAKTELEAKYSNINIVGYLNGYNESEEEVIKNINKVKPNILFVALGSPKQEKFIINNMEKIQCNIFQGVGGSFDVIAKIKKRAPKWMRNFGLEWLYRLIKEPKRIFRQIKLVTFLITIIFNDMRGIK